MYYSKKILRCQSFTIKYYIIQTFRVLNALLSVLVDIRFTLWNRLWYNIKITIDLMNIY